MYKVLGLYPGLVKLPMQQSVACVRTCICWLQICTVFAQLTVEGKWQGPHVFVVRLRGNNSQLTPGVKILDNGPKMGLNGVDNGQIWFDHVKVPRDALLDKYASVSAEGVYTSSIKSVSQRFGVTVGGLTTGAWTDCAAEESAAVLLHHAATSSLQLSFSAMQWSA